MDIIEILKKKQGFLLLANIVLSAYQKRMGEDAGIKPGDEMAAAIKKAKELGIPQIMVDRPVTVTLRRAWKKILLWENASCFRCLLPLLFQRRSFGN